SPTCITFSPASDGRNGMIILAPPRPGTGGGGGTLPAFSAAMSFAVGAASTFFPLRGSSGLDYPTRGCGGGERPDPPQSGVGRRGSSMKRPAPRTSASSSTRGVCFVLAELVVMRGPGLRLWNFVYSPNG